MSSHLPVAVIGAGPCGLMMALLLARQGIHCEVFERHSGLSTHPKAMGVSRRTAEIYRQHGLLAAMEQGSLPLHGTSLAIWSHTLAGGELGRVEFSELQSSLTPVTPLHCPQTWTERVLFEALQAEPLGQVHFEKAVRSVHPSDDAVRLEFEDGSNCEADWVVAADGASSGVRHQLGIETDGPGDMGHFLNIMFRASLDRVLGGRRAVLHQALWEEGFESFVTVNGTDVWLMHHFLQPGETVDDFSREKLIGLIRAATGSPGVAVEILNVSPWVMSPKVARRFRAGRIFLAGDAAARLSPAGGLGMNTGLQSVHNLAWKLAEVICGRGDDSLLDSYEKERRGASLRTMSGTNQNAGEIVEIVTAGLSGHWDEVRRLIAQSRRGGSHLGEDLGVRYETGAFIPDGSSAPETADPINDYRPVAQPGSRSPHLMVDHEHASVPLLDLLGTGFAVLAGRKASVEPRPQWKLLRNGKEFSAEEFETVFEITPEGAVLVRPDGIISARWKEPVFGNSDIESALSQILRPGRG